MRRSPGHIAAVVLLLALAGGCDGSGGIGDSTDGDAGVVADSGSGTFVDSVLFPDSVADPDPDAVPDAVADADPDPDSVADPDPDAVADADPDPDADPDADTDPDPDTTPPTDTGPLLCPDADDDGVCDPSDACGLGDDHADRDGDTLPDACDACPDDAMNDYDGDGLCAGVDPCPLSADHTDIDGDGTPDACDVCPHIPRVLVYDQNSDHAFAVAAVTRIGCEHTVVGVAGFTAELRSGRYGAVVVDMPDARPEGDWAAALLDFIADGGAAVLASWRLDAVAGPSVPATFGVLLGPEHEAPHAIRPTWRHPTWTGPYDLTAATLTPGPSSATFNGAPLIPAAGRVWATFPSGQAAIVQSNGGRTFIDGLLWDDYPYDTDGDGVADVVELIANQLVWASHARIPRDLTPPSVTNFDATVATTVRYDLPLLRGGHADDAAEVTVRTNADVRVWPVAGGRWKALTPLTPGDNWITIESGPAVTWLHLVYQPQTNPRTVRVVYALASDDDQRFDAPAGEPDELASARRRLALGARLLQSAVADRLHQEGLGRHTFRVARDPSGEPTVALWQTTATTAQWWAMSGAELWSYIWAHQGEWAGCADCVTVIILGMTHYDPAQGRALAHTALGGGRVALFGSGTLYSWAEHLDEVAARLSDDALVSGASPPVYDDSGGRGTFWANYATGLGAVLHEIGHALDLPHSLQTADLLSRGFDQTNRVFMMSEPPSLHQSGVDAIWITQEPRFAFANARRLRHHRALALDHVSYSVNAPPQVRREGDTVIIETAAGLRVIGYAVSREGDWRVQGGHHLSGAPPTRYELDVPSLRFLFAGETQVKLLITDDQGNLRDDFVVAL